MKRTKIIATIGPASDSEQVLGDMIQAGMDVARLNFSHNTHRYHQTVFERLGAVARAAGKHIGILQDLSGPKIRIGLLPQDLPLAAGQHIAIGHELPIVPAVAHLLKKGGRILIEDGKIELVVIRTEGNIPVAEVRVPGVVRTGKGVNLPGTKLPFAALTNKDRDDVRFGLSLGVDFVALSFVRNRDDILKLRQYLEQHRHSADLPWVIAKIERPEALEHFEEILSVADGIMIGRGDLGVEMPEEKIPVLQREMARSCLRHGKPFIIATQMLESMSQNEHPTRAEVSDVATAVTEHADAVMLSGETATGKNPLTAVSMMASVIRETEISPFDNLPLESSKHRHLPQLHSFAHQIYHTAAANRASAIVLLHPTLPLVQSLSRHRPERLIIPVFRDEHIARKCALLWGVVGLVQKEASFETLARSNGFIPHLSPHTPGSSCHRDEGVHFVNPSSRVSTLLKGAGFIQKGSRVIVVDGRELAVRTVS